MKTSKLLLTSLLAAATMSAVPAFGAGSADTILINFTGGRSDVEPVAVTNDTVNGTWNNEAGASQSTPQTLLFSNNTESSATITWSSANTYTTGLAETDKVLTGYLDDGGSQAQITVSNISYTVYDVVVLAATDQAARAFSAVTINGTVYTSAGGIAVAGNDTWGTSKNTTIAPGVNSMTLSGVMGSSLSINGGANSNGARGGIAGIQIFDQTGRIWGATLSGDVNWGDISWSCTDGTEPDAKAWSAITADNLTADLSGTGTVTVGAEGVTLNRLRVLSGTTTLAGGTVTFNGPQNEINVLSGATLALNAADVALETNVSGVNLVGTGTINFKDSFNSETYGKFSNLASFSGTVKFDGAVNLGTDALSVSSGTREFAGGLTAGGVTVTGGTLNLNSSVEVSGNTSDSKGFRQQGGTVNLGDGTNAASLTVVDFVGSSNGGADGTFNIKNNAVMTVTGTKNNATAGFAHSFQLAHWSATETFYVDGVLNLSNVSLSSKDGVGVVNVRTGGELNLNVGLAMAVNGGSVRLNLSGGTMNIGVNGIASGQTLNLNSGTIGSLADSWTSSRDMALGGAIVVDTTKKIYTEGAAAVATASGSEVALNGVLSDATDATGSLTKRGAGTLTLGGANTYTGATVVEAGTLVAGNATAFGSANMAALTVKTGAAVRVDTGVSLKDLTLESGTRLLLGNLAVGGTAFTVSGTASVAANQTIDVAGLASGTYTVVSGGAPIDWSWLDASDFVLSGTHQTISNISTTTSSFTISSSNIDLVWNGTDGDKWSNGGEKVWTVAGSATESDFMNGDNVTFDENASVAVDVGGVTAGKVTIASGKTVTLTGGNVTAESGFELQSGARLSLGAGSANGATATLADNSVYAITASAASSEISLANVTGGVDSTIEINAYISPAFTTISGMSSGFSGTLKVTGGFLNLSNPSIINDSNVKEVVLSGGIGDSSTTGSGLCFMGGNTSLSFSKNIVAKGEGGVLRSYASTSNVVEFTGSVTGTTIRHSDGGTHKFSGTVDLQKFVQSGAADNQTVTEFAGTTTLGTLEQILGTTKFTGGTANVGTMVISGGALNISGGTVSVTALNISGGTVSVTALNISGSTTTISEGALNISGTTTISGGTTTTENGTTVGNGGVLEISTGGQESALCGMLTVNSGGKVKLMAGDATGWGGGASAINKLVLNEGAELYITEGYGTGIANQDGKNQTFNMSGGIELTGAKITGTTEGGKYSKFDLYNENTGITVHASSVTSEISTVLGLRKSGSITVEKGTTPDGVDLLISGMLTNSSYVTTGTMDATSALTKSGAGTMKLTGDNQYWTSGGRVTEGTLIAASTTALGKGGTISVSEGATLGFVAGTTVDMLKTTTTNDVTTTTNGAIQLTSGAKIVVDMLGQDANQEKIVLDLVSGVALSYGGVDVTADNVDTLLDSVISLKNWGDGWTQLLSYADNTLSLTLTIPEPSTFGLLAGLGALALTGTRRRRKKA